MTRHESVIISVFHYLVVADDFAVHIDLSAASSCFITCAAESLHVCERVSFTFCVSGAAAVSGVVNFHYKTHQKHAASSVSSACNII